MDVHVYVHVYIIIHMYEPTFVHDTFIHIYVLIYHIYIYMYMHVFVRSSLMCNGRVQASSLQKASADFEWVALVWASRHRVQILI